MKATTLLEHQHRRLHELCEAVRCADAATRQLLLPQLASDLLAHWTVEDEVFFPARTAR